MKTIELTNEEFEWLKNTCIEKLILSEQLLEIHEIPFVKKDLKMSKSILEKLHENSTHQNNIKREKKFELTAEELEVVRASLSSTKYLLEKTESTIERDIAIEDIDSILTRIKDFKNGKEMAND